MTTSVSVVELTSTIIRTPIREIRGKERKLSDGTTLVSTGGHAVTFISGVGNVVCTCGDPECQHRLDAVTILENNDRVRRAR